MPDNRFANFSEGGVHAKPCMLPLKPCLNLHDLGILFVSYQVIYEMFNPYPAALAYGVYIFQLIRYSRACGA